MQPLRRVGPSCPHDKINNFNIPFNHAFPEKVTNINISLQTGEKFSSDILHNQTTILESIPQLRKIARWWVIQVSSLPWPLDPLVVTAALDAPGPLTYWYHRTCLFTVTQNCSEVKSSQENAVKWGFKPRLCVCLWSHRQYFKEGQRGVMRWALSLLNATVLPQEGKCAK